MEEFPDNERLFTKIFANCPKLETLKLEFGVSYEAIICNKTQNGLEYKDVTCY